MNSRHTSALLLLLAASVLNGCAKSEAEREAEARQKATPVRAQPNGSIRLTEADRRNLGLAIAAVQQGNLQQSADRVGMVQTPVGAEVVVAAPISGRIVRGPLTTVGSPVSAGTLILTIAPTFDASERASIGVQAADLEGQIQQTERELVAKDAEAKRLRELRGERIVSASRQQAAEADAGSARARLEALRRQRAVQAKDTAQTADVRAPAAGLIAEISGATGAQVHIGDTMARILRTTERLIDVGVAPDEPQGSGYLVLFNASWAPARFVSRGATVSADGLRHDQIAIDNPQLLPGSSVSVRILRTGGGIVVPESAIVTTADGDLVFVQQASDSFIARKVHVAERLEGSARIDQGLQPGEIIVTHGAVALYGERVRPLLQ